MSTPLQNRGGRKKNHFVAANGDQVKGLSYHEKSGRWRIIEGNRFFRAANEAEAIQKYYAMTAPPGLKDLEAKIDDYVRIYVTPKKEAEAAYWARVKEDISNRPQLVAKKTGFEWIAWGAAEIKPPQPLPSLDQIESEWTTHAKCASEQIKKVLRAWKDFRAKTKINDLRDIKAETVVAYSDAVSKGGFSGKQQQHLFTGVRRILRFAKSRALASEVIAEKLGFLELLRADRETVTRDPQPIEREHWDKLLSLADDEDRAMLLLMMNAALYAQEVVRIEWDDIKDGCLITNRKKTGKCIRVAVLWQETIDALAKVERRGQPTIFNTYAGLPIKRSGAQRRWGRLALKAGLATQRIANYKGVKKPVITCQVTASQLRDGAATAMAENNVTERLIALVLGHRSGISDHYVKRSPLMVKPATEAVYQKYMVK